MKRLVCTAIAVFGFVCGTSQNAMACRWNPTTSNILWQNTSTTETSIWQMSNNAIANYITPASTVSSSWQVKGIGDFDADGIDDVLWLDTSTNQINIWQMNGSGGITQSHNISNDVSGWVVLGTGDFNGDLTTDVLWYNPSTAATSIWQMHNHQIANYLTPVSTLPSTLTFQGTGDFNGDGISDIIWLDTSTNSITVWQMSGLGAIASSPNISNNVSGWDVLGVGYFRGDGAGFGTSDILWRNTTTTTTTSIWQMSNDTIGTIYNSPSIPATWQFRGAGDFNQDGYADVLWLDTSNNEMNIWQMDSSGHVVSPAHNISNDVSGWAVKGILTNSTLSCI